MVKKSCTTHGRQEARTRGEGGGSGNKINTSESSLNYGPPPNRLFSMMLPTLKSTMSTWGTGRESISNCNYCRKTTSGKEEKTTQER